MLALINDILDLSRVEAGRLEIYPSQVDVQELIEDVVGTLEPLAASKGIQLSHGERPQRAVAFTDEDKLRQILLNLVGNAVKFTEEGHVTVTVTAGQDQVRVGVEDTGIGIPKDAIGGIFQEFHQAESGTTRRFGGTGLGLAISMRLARLLGGTIEVRSALDEGSTFTVVLPLAAAKDDRRSGTDGDSRSGPSL